MRQIVRFPIIAVLTLLSMQGVAQAPSDGVHERFSVTPSGREVRYGTGTPDTVFTFTADVTGAVSYELDFGDRSERVQCKVHDGSRAGDAGYCRMLEPGSYKAVFRHVYPDLQSYTPRLTAVRATNERIELPLGIRVNPEPVRRAPESREQFLVTPSAEAGYTDVEEPQADFEFTGLVMGAESYELNFGDGTVETGIAPGSDGQVVLRHRYLESGDFTAVMRAWRDTGESVEIRSLVSATVRAADPPPTEAYTNFRAAPIDVDSSEATFEFTADVSDASAYDIDFGDGTKLEGIEPDATGQVVLTHVYSTPGSYTAQMGAQRSSGPPAAATLKLPVTLLPEPPEPKILWWPLILAAIAVLLSTFWVYTAAYTGTDLVSFEPTVDPGTIRVSAAARAEDGLSMRLRRGPVRTEIKMRTGERQ